MWYMIKRWFSRTTPFVILSVIIIIVLLVNLIVERGGTDAWQYLVIYSLLPSLIIMLIIDLLLKWAIKKATKWIWIIEVILMSGFAYWWIIT